MRNSAVKRHRGRSREKLEETFPVQQVQVDLRVLADALRRVNGDRKRIRIRDDGTVVINPNGITP